MLLNCIYCGTIHQHWIKCVAIKKWNYANWKSWVNSMPTSSPLVFLIVMGTSVQTSIIIPPPSGVSGGILDSHFPSVWRRYCFRSVTQVLWNLNFKFHMHIFVAIGRSLSIFKDITSKMAAWQPYWIFRFPDSNFSLALNTQSKLHLHITCVCGKRRIDFQQCYI